MKTGLKKSFFILFLALFGILGFALISALIAWLERKIYRTASTALRDNKKTWQAEVEAQTLHTVTQLLQLRDEEQESR